MPRYVIHTTAAGTTVAVPASAGKVVQVARFYSNANGSGTIELQDTSGASLSGAGGLPTAANTAIWLDGALVLFEQGLALFQTPVGLGLQLVTTGAITINGFIDYLLNPP